MLTSKQRATLRGIASTYETIFQVGKGGISDTLVQQVSDALRKRELIKMHVLDNCPLDAREAAQELAEKTESEVVQVIGNRLVQAQSQRAGGKVLMQRIGLFGGSFNPIHNGHLHLAKAAKEGLGLDKVVLIPANVSPFKQDAPGMASGADRLAMCRLAAETLPFCEVDSCELERSGVSYTVDTVRLFRERYPEAELVLLVGSDMFLSFTWWHCWQEILEMAALGVVSRMTGDLEQLRRQQAFLLQYGKIFLCDVPVYTVSSTKIRENRKNHTDFSCYLPQKVVQYIVSHNLYD